MSTTTNETAAQKAEKIGAPLPLAETASAVLSKPVYNEEVSGEDSSEDRKTPFLSLIHGTGKFGQKNRADIGKFLLKNEIVMGTKLNVIFCKIDKYWAEILPPPYDPADYPRKFLKLEEARAVGLNDDYSKTEAYVGKAADCVMAIEIPESVNDAGIDYNILLGGKPYTIAKFTAKKSNFSNGISPILTKMDGEKANAKANNTTAHLFRDYTWTFEIREVPMVGNLVPVTYSINPVLHSPEISDQLGIILGFKPQPDVQQ